MKSIITLMGDADQIKPSLMQATNRPALTSNEDEKSGNPNDGKVIAYLEVKESQFY